MKTLNFLRQMVLDNNAKYKEEYLRIDACIFPFVNFLKLLGFITYASCSSHKIKNSSKYQGTPYVMFYFTNQQRFLLYKLISKFNRVRSIFYTIEFNIFNCNSSGQILEEFSGNMNNDYLCCILNIHFSWIVKLFNLKRENIFKRIYSQNNIEFEENNIIIEEERENYGNTHSDNFSIFKNKYEDPVYQQRMSNLEVY